MGGGIFIEGVVSRKLSRKLSRNEGVVVTGGDIFIEGVLSRKVSRKVSWYEGVPPEGGIFIGGVADMDGVVNRQLS